jgi:hypothetical protein
MNIWELKMMNQVTYYIWMDGKKINVLFLWIFWWMNIWMKKSTAPWEEEVTMKLLVTMHEN